MRSILRRLPIRWQITLLNATILAVVLAAGGLALWNAQRTFQYDGLIAKQLTELRALIPAGLDPKLEASLDPLQNADPQLRKQRYAKIAAAILPPDEDSALTRKRLALLDPQLAERVFPPGSALPARGELEATVSKLVFELFPPDEDLKDTRKKLMSLDPKLAADLSPSPTLDEAVYRKYLTGIVQQLSASDRGATIFARDGAVLAQSSFGPACAASSYVLKAALAASAGEDLFKQLKLAQHIQQVEDGQLILLLPVSGPPSLPPALAQICVPTDPVDASLRQLAASLLVGWALVVGVATALGVTATRRVLRPLDQVVATTGRIAAGDLGQRVGLPPGRTELARLGAAFDAMVARLERAFAAQRRFVADAAHELRTPLTALSASVELLLMGAAEQDPPTAQRLLRHLDGELSRVIRLTNDLLTLSTLDARPQLALRPTNLNELLEQLAEHSRALLRGQELLVDVAPGLWVAGDADRLRQVVLNLLDNARKYTPAGGRISVRAYTDHRSHAADYRLPSADLDQRPGHIKQAEIIPDVLVSDSSAVARSSVVVVEVQDSGVGIPADALPHLFDRFYRVDSARARASGGSGLGLAIVHSIVRAHHGQVDIRSRPGAGTCVTIELPWLPAASASPLAALQSSSDC